MVNTLGPRIYQQPVVQSVALPQATPQMPAQTPGYPQAQSAGSDLGAMIAGFFTKLVQALSTFFKTLFGSAPAQAPGGQSVNSVPYPTPVPTQPAMVITPETRMAAMQALPHIDLLTQHVAMLKPTLEMLQVKKPSPTEILNFLMESKIALTSVSQGMQPNFRSQTVGVSAMGKDMLKFATDTLGVVMAAKGLAGLFKVNDPNITKSLTDIEAGLMSVRTAGDILSRNPQ